MTDLGTLRQHHLLMQLLRLSREQRDALRSGRADRFLELMESRESLIAQLGDSLATPPPDNVVAFPTVSADDVVSDVRAAIRGLLASLAEQDRENGRLLHEQLDRLQSALARIGGSPVTSTARMDDADRTPFNRDERAAPRRRSNQMEGGRAQRVAALKAQVRAGTYEVDTRALAEKLLAVL
jgi:anti-sigma28 factor (negative regulator of flagellin synthesis)